MITQRPRRTTHFLAWRFLRQSPGSPRPDVARALGIEPATLLQIERELGLLWPAFIHSAEPANLPDSLSFMQHPRRYAGLAPEGTLEL